MVNGGNVIFVFSLGNIKERLIKVLLMLIEKYLFRIVYDVVIIYC